MRTYIILVCLIAFLGCHRAEPNRAEKTQFKGMELYSWKPADKDWHFWLFPGTNGTKAGLGLFKPESATLGLAQLKKQISLLAKGETIGWQNIGDTPVPESLQSELTGACGELGIDIHMVYFEKITME